MESACCYCGIEIETYNRPAHLSHSVVLHETLFTGSDVV